MLRVGYRFWVSRGYDDTDLGYQCFRMKKFYRAQPRQSCAAVKLDLRRDLHFRPKGPSQLNAVPYGAECKGESGVPTSPRIMVGSRSIQKDALA